MAGGRERDVFQAASDGVVVVAELERETLRVDGPDATTWLNGLVSCDLSRLDPTRGAYGLLLSKQGKIQTDMDVIVGSSGVYASLAAGTGEAIRATLDRHLVMEDAELTLEPSVVFLRVVGSRAPEVLARLGEHPAVVATGTLDWLGFDGGAVAARRTDVESVIARALELAGDGGSRATPEEWDALRISRAFPAFGRDYGADDNPHEASLEKLAVSFSKGCYLGQEVVCMQDMRGKVKRRLISLELQADARAETGTDVFTEAGEAVGQVTSSARSGTRTLALARVRAPHFDTTESLKVGGAPVSRLVRD